MKDLSIKVLNEILMVEHTERPTYAYYKDEFLQFLKMCNKYPSTNTDSIKNNVTLLYNKFYQYDSLIYRNYKKIETALIPWEETNYELLVKNNVYKNAETCLSNVFYDNNISHIFDLIISEAKTEVKGEKDKFGIKGSNNIISKGVSLLPIIQKGLLQISSNNITIPIYVQTIKNILIIQKITDNLYS